LRSPSGRSNGITEQQQAKKKVRPQGGLTAAADAHISFFSSLMKILHCAAGFTKSSSKAAATGIKATVWGILADGFPQWTSSTRAPSPADLALHFGPCIELDTGLGTTTADQDRSRALHQQCGRPFQVSTELATFSCGASLVHQATIVEI
jgi:hypothetical protein